MFHEISKKKCLPWLGVLYVFLYPIGRPFCHVFYILAYFLSHCPFKCLEWKAAEISNCEFISPFTFSSRSFFSLGLSHTTLWENQSITCQLFHGAGLRGEKSALHLAPSELQKRQVFFPHCCLV